MRQALRDAVGSRLNDATLDKVARNAASSWSQAGHLTGRTFKIRRPVQPTFSTVALAMLLGYSCGSRGEALLDCDWLKVIDCQPSQARALAIGREAARLHRPADGGRDYRCRVRPNGSLEG